MEPRLGNPHGSPLPGLGLCLEIMGSYSRNLQQDPSKSLIDQIGNTPGQLNVARACSIRHGLQGPLSQKGGGYIP
jgi:hypothetical protein